MTVRERGLEARLFTRFLARAALVGSLLAIGCGGAGSDRSSHLRRGTEGDATPAAMGEPPAATSGAPTATTEMPAATRAIPVAAGAMPSMTPPRSGATATSGSALRPSATSARGRSGTDPAAAASNDRLPPSTPAASSPVADLWIAAQLDRYHGADSGTPDDRQTRIELIREMGSVGTRLAFEWGAIEAQPGTHTWALHDSIVDELEAAGLRTYGMLGYTAAWARPPRTRRTHRPVVEGSPERGDTAFATFAAAVARRYAGRVEAWEIWNEPNVPGFWLHVEAGVNRGPDPAEYVELYRLARDSILAADPGAVVVSGGLAAGQGRRRSVPDPLDPERPITVLPGHDFLRAMIEAGFEPDRVGLHPYSNRPPGAARFGTSVPMFPDLVLDSALAVLDAAGYPDALVWVTEWGVNQRLGRSDADVERWYADALPELLCHPRIPVVTIYVLTDWGARHRFGLYDRTGALRAAGRGLQTVTRGGVTCPPG